MQALAVAPIHPQSGVTPQPRLEKAAYEFEAQLIKELLRPMTSRDDETESGSFDALADFAGEALGQALSRRGGFGIASSILHSLSQNGKEPQNDPAAGKVAT